MRLHRNTTIRRLLMPVFAKFNPGDIKIRHHHTGDRILLHSFKHRGYWFHGKKREINTIKLFSALIRPGDTVLDVGGHIGYMSLIFGQLVEQGQVFVFEPDPNNRKYLLKNTHHKDNIKVINKGAGPTCEERLLFQDSLSGQNSSFVEDFQLAIANQQAAYYAHEKRCIQVEVITLDSFAKEKQHSPSFIKIDVEGFELSVLAGMNHLLSAVQPILMVEIQADHEKIFHQLTQHAYLAFT